jgi:hypothetical protein
MPFARQPGSGSAAPKKFIVRVRGDDQNIHNRMGS